MADSVVGGYADAVMALIDADIAAGVVPADVAGFSALHDYVDGNQYLVDVNVPFGPDVSPDEDEGLRLVNAVASAVDARLRRRR